MTDDPPEEGMQRYFEKHGLAGRNLSQEARERIAKRGSLSPATIVLCAVLFGIAILIGWAAISRASAETCQIKGNINRRGAKIAHAPGSPDYAATRIDEQRGERMFCSEDEAKAAGWRMTQGRREAPARSMQVPNPFR